MLKPTDDALHATIYYLCSREPFDAAKGDTLHGFAGRGYSERTGYCSLMGDARHKDTYVCDAVQHLVSAAAAWLLLGAPRLLLGDGWLDATCVRCLKVGPPHHRTSSAVHGRKSWLGSFLTNGRHATHPIGQILWVRVPIKGAESHHLWQMLLGKLGCCLGGRLGLSIAATHRLLLLRRCSGTGQLPAVS